MIYHDTEIIFYLKFSDESYDVITVKRVIPKNVNVKFAILSVLTIICIPILLIVSLLTMPISVLNTVAVILYVILCVLIFQMFKKDKGDKKVFQSSIVDIPQSYLDVARRVYFLEVKANAAKDLGSIESVESVKNVLLDSILTTNTHKDDYLTKFDIESINELCALTEDMINLVKRKDGPDF